ncbi:MAG: FAD-binding protein [Lentisphaeria bacterium]|jgi:succinate dehydrogenase/fumarate reductase flavoprotein subunit
MHSAHIQLRLAAGAAVPVPVHSLNTLVVGAGTAALKCALSLHERGIHDLAIAVDRLGAGTSNNSGSDKQTYYKLGVFGDAADSPLEMAQSLFQGGMMHGDLAYIEALGSLPAFFELCRLGVPFPCNAFGAYVGYKTDHDPRQRATSAGPKTSMLMFQKLLLQVQRLGIPIFDRHQAVRLLTIPDPAAESGRRVIGAACVNKGELHGEHFGLTLFNARNVVLGTGGPGELYQISAWPHGQHGAHGLALEAGAVANNLTELQYGLASTKFRWNLSGTYQQVVPDYFSTAADGTADRRHFLHDYFASMAEMATAVFLKGYQWPFHAARLQERGSSLVDLAVHHEIAAGRRVFLDFSRNLTPAPGMRTFALAELAPEARTYLERSGAHQPTPYGRLQQMNPQSIDLYAEHGIDLRQPLEAAVCAQHCNGGIRGDRGWESSVANLFTIGELAGTHGVRPGGSALNAGQVGAMRAAQRIAAVHHQPPPGLAEFALLATPQAAAQHAEFAGWLDAGAAALTLAAVRPQIQERMSRAAAFVRAAPVVEQALQEAKDLFAAIRARGIRCPDRKTLLRALEDRHLALTSIAFLEALRHYIAHGGGSRGGYMILDAAGSLWVESQRGRELPHRPENLALRREILEIRQRDAAPGEFSVRPVPVRPLPRDESWFETVWAEFQAAATTA